MKNSWKERKSNKEEPQPKKNAKNNWLKLKGPKQNNLLPTTQLWTISVVPQVFLSQSPRGSWDEPRCVVPQQRNPGTKAQCFLQQAANKPAHSPEGQGVAQQSHVVSLAHWRVCVTNYQNCSLSGEIWNLLFDISARICKGTQKWWQTALLTRANNIGIKLI